MEDNKEIIEIRKNVQIITVMLFLQFMGVLLVALNYIL